MVSRRKRQSVNLQINFPNDRLLSDDDLYRPNSASGGGGGGIDGDDPTFLLEHLATFTVSRDNANGVVYPEDGMRRLLQLEKTTGIWSQKMEIALTKNRHVMIQDYDTKSVIEKFPVNWIEAPTPFTNTDPMELYNNILIFIVAPPPGIANHSFPEMHIFHCQNIDANILCNYLVNLKRGTDEVDYDRQRGGGGGGGGGGAGGMESKEMHMQRHSEQRGSRNKYNRSDSGLDEGQLPKSMFNSTLLSDKYERDVQVLNYCFDDIEKFIARLQHSAAASRELERRRRSKKYKNGYQDPGEGLLSLRTRPPTEAEFCDVFAKFKLSFNLLAKLKSHIHDPNAPELIHFLFTPLALIVDASHDIIPMSHGGDGSSKSFNLPSQVVAPLLTTEAINLLVNCVTSKETELWRSLGEAWQLPRSKFCIKYNHVGDVNYHPTFYDGWSPDFPLNFDESSDDTAPQTPPAMMGGGPSGHGGMASAAAAIAAASSGRRVSKTEKEPNYMHHHHKELEDSISIDSIEHRGHGMVGGSHPGERDRHHHQQQLPQQHHHQQQQQQQQQSTSARKNHERAASSGGEHEERDVNGWIHELQSRRAKIVHVTYPRTANNEKEMTVHRGEILEVLDDTRKWWKARNMHGEIGHVPHTIVSPWPGNGGDKMGNGSSGNGGGGQDVFQNPLYSKDYQK